MDLRRALQQLDARQSPPAAATVDKAPLVEIFHSIQGEGRYVGQPMAFLRVATCPLRCLYCDTPNSYAASARFPVRCGGRELPEPNPVAATRAAELVQQVAKAMAPGLRQNRVSVTGGEPLVFPQFVRSFGRAVRAQGFRLHLETAAVHPAALAECIDQVDHLSADYKLPETLGTPADGKPYPPGHSHGADHRQCVEIALRRGATVDLKVVLMANSMDPSIERICDEMLPFRDKILLVLQPVTPFGAVKRSVAAADLERYAAMVGRAGFDFRVLPQVHKAMQLP